MDGRSQCIVYFEENRAACLGAILALATPVEALYTRYIAAGSELPAAANLNTVRDHAEELLRQLTAIQAAFRSTEYMVFVHAFNGMDNDWKVRAGRVQAAVWWLQFMISRVHSATEMKLVIKRKRGLILRIAAHVAAVVKLAVRLHAATPADTPGLQPVPDTAAMTFLSAFEPARDATSGLRAMLGM